MDEEEGAKLMRVVVVVAIAAILGIAIMGGLYGWYVYKSIGTRADNGTSVPTVTPSPSGIRAVLQTLTPTSTQSMFSPEEEAKIRALLTPTASAQAHPVNKATLDSLTPPVK